jgi:hypothetical protein
MSLTLTLERGGGGEVSGSGTNIELDGTIAGGAIESVEMYGDTEQTTYSGKNLINIPGAADTTGFVKNNNGGFTLTKISDTGRFSPKFNFSIPANTPVTISYKANTSSTAATMFCQWYCADNTYLWAPSIDRDNATGSVTTTFNKEITGVVFYFQATQANGTYMTVENFQIELGSAKTSFEPYVGGTASPNPDYPQEVQTVTGEQTITVSDGNSQSETYTLNLGSIELCKIGDYQDYIYKSGDDWYLHKEIDKVLLDGTQYVTQYATATANKWRFTCSVYGAADVSADVVVNMSDKFVGVTRGDTWNNKNGVYQLSGGVGFYWEAIAGYTREQVQTWLSTNNVTAYYPLATPTDTQITDSTLIGQLNALNAGETYDGTTLITVSSENLVGSLEVKALLSAEKTYTEVEIGSPFTISDVEGKSSTTTLNGNVYVDFAYIKKSFQVDIFNLSTSDYSDIRDFYDYQFTSGKFITLSIPELSISDMPVYMEMSKRNIVSQCLTTDKITLNFRETVQP